MTTLRTHQNAEQNQPTTTLIILYECKPICKSNAITKQSYIITFTDELLFTNSIKLIFFHLKIMYNYNYN